MKNSALSCNCVSEVFEEIFQISRCQDDYSFIAIQQKSCGHATGFAVDAEEFPHEDQEEQAGNEHENIDCEQFDKRIDAVLQLPDKKSMPQSYHQ